MADQFPGIKPATRRFRLGQFPVKIYRALSGATVKRAFGNRAYGYELSLGFENITDSAVVQIIDHYNATSAGFQRFTLPAEIFAGMNAALTGRIQSPTQIKWEYAEPPDVDSVITGLSTVSVVFVGELDY
jgi:hypothetical protein